MRRDVRKTDRLESQEDVAGGEAVHTASGMTREKCYSRCLSTLESRYLCSDPALPHVLAM